MPRMWLLKKAWLMPAVFVVLGTVYALTTPLFEISDELWHYPMVKTLADGQGLPVQDPVHPGAWRQEGSQPPLYYFLMAFATTWIDTSDMAQVRWFNPHADNGIITEDRNNNIIVHSASEPWAWHGTALAVRVIRLLSVLLGAGAVYFTYRLALEVWPGQSALAQGAAGIAAFTPMFVFISASVNNDTLAVFCSAATLWLLAGWLNHPPQKMGWPHLWLGVLLGCGALSKQSALGLWALAGAVLFYSHFIQRRSRSGFFGIWNLILESSSVFGLAALLSFWWYFRNYQLYGDWLGWNTFIAIVGARPRPASLALLWGERVGFMQAYWGLLGGVSVPLPGWAYTVLNTLVGFAVLGLGSGAVRAARKKIALAEAVRWALPVAWIVLICIGLARWTSLTWASQGRLVFPAISAISLLIAVGLSQFSFSLRHSPFVIVHLSFAFLLTLATPFAILIPHYTPPPELNAEQIAAIPNRVDIDFGGEMILLGYKLEVTTVTPGEAVRLTLYWQSQMAMDRNWSVFVHLVDAEEIIVAQRDRYPGQGLWATTLLHPGQTFADEYVIPVPEVTIVPRAAHLEVGMYDVVDGARLLTTSGDDAVTLAEVALSARENESVPNAIHQNFGNLIELTGYTLEPRVVRAGETVTVTLYWQALQPIATNYAVFTHVRGAGETLWAGQDAWPQNGAAPTVTWRVGHLITDTYALTLKPDTPPGQWAVEVGVYDSESLVRLQLLTDDGRWTDADYLYLSKIRVVGP